jgi:hypothetical protein
VTDYRVEPPSRWEALRLVVRHARARDRGKTPDVAYEAPEAIRKAVQATIAEGATEEAT